MRDVIRIGFRGMVGVGLWAKVRLWFGFEVRVGFRGNFRVGSRQTDLVWPQKLRRYNQKLMKTHCSSQCAKSSVSELYVVRFVAHPHI